MNGTLHECVGVQQSSRRNPCHFGDLKSSRDPPLPGQKVQLPPAPNGDASTPSCLGGVARVPRTWEPGATKVCPYRSCA